MKTNRDFIGKDVTVYDRYLFAVPVRGYITDISEKDGAFAVTFYNDNPAGQNVIKHNGKFFHYQQCDVEESTYRVIRSCDTCRYYKDNVVCTKADGVECNNEGTWRSWAPRDQKELIKCDLVSLDFEDDLIQFNIPKSIMNKGFHGGSVLVDFSGVQD